MAKEISQEAVDFLAQGMAAGRPIPGQSLTNSPEEARRWEQPPEFTVPKEAMYYIFERIIEPEVAENILLSIVNGVGVIDIASMILYSGFLEGKWTPDIMLLLTEPTLYMLMALAEKAEVSYLLEGIDAERREVEPEEQLTKMEESVSYLDSLRRKAAEGVDEQSVPTELREEIEEVELPTSLLEKVQTTIDDDSLLARGEK